jgi:CheY-like chemotaxis protein
MAHTIRGRSSAEASGDDVTVLLCEANPSFRRLISLLLEGHGYRVVACAPGDDLEALPNLTQVNVAVVDLNLNGWKSDWSVLDTVRNNPKTGNVPVIVTATSKSAFVNPPASYANNCVPLVKPFDLTELHVTLQSLLRA